MNLASSIFNSRVRGIRVVEIITFVLLVVLVFGVYIAKARASRERAQIADIEQRIGDEQRQVKLLRAEDARLEQPARIETLSEGAGLKPVDSTQETSPNALPAVAAEKTRPVAKTPADPNAAASPAPKEPLQ
ncbi:MAG TPA: cell division protein [Caulobacteraceae bacterium]|jgi:cell division protein FtsL